MYYRICERKNGKLYTLFHKVYVSRYMPINIWLDARVEEVRDGSKKTAKAYKSGFHVFKDADECASFIKMFRKPRDLVMVECEIGNTWPKEHSRSNVLLTDKIKLICVVKDLKIPKYE